MFKTLPHQVYNIVRHIDGVCIDAIVRVASPAFPKDKLESEVSIHYVSAQRVILHNLFSGGYPSIYQSTYIYSCSD
jgi:hypothetical protein